MSQEWCWCENCGRVQPMHVEDSLWETDDQGEPTPVQSCAVCRNPYPEPATATDRHLSEWLLGLQDSINQLHAS